MEKSATIHNSALKIISVPLKKLQLPYFKRFKFGVSFCYLFLMSFFISSTAYATTYYVSTSGNNSNNGTSVSTPWRDINYAVNYSGLTGGDIIYIRGGSYFERVVMLKSGSLGNNITVSNYTGEIPIIDGSGMSSPGTYHSGLFEAKGSNVIVNGLKAINARFDDNAKGIVVIGPVTNVVIQYCVTNNTGSSGISIWGQSTTTYTGATNITIQNCDISQAVCGGYQENLSIADGVDNFIIRYNVVHDCTTAPNSVNIPLGIDAKTNVRNGQIYNNTIYNLSYASGIYVDGYDNTAYNIDIYNNVIHNVAHSGIQIGAEQAGTDYNINVYNNLVYNNAEHGIAVNGSNISTPNNIHDVKIYNNTVYGNGYYGGHILNTAAWAIAFKNNIFSQNGWGNGVTLYTSNKANADVSNNVTDGVMNAWLSGTECYIGANAILANPLFVSASGANFKLNSGSPAIDAATTALVAATDFDGNSRPVGNGYDIGAYEYGSTIGSVAVTGVSMSPSTASITVGVTQQLTATVAPSNATNQTVSWSSSNTAVATVDATGLVSGIATGSATITVSTQDGSKTDTCAVTVTASGYGTNMLVNPGFENALTTGWTADWGNSTPTTAVKNSGSYSLQVGPGQGGRAQILTSGFIVGATYTLFAYCMMSGSGGPAGTDIGVVCKDAAGNRIATITSPDITNTGTFVKTGVTFTVPSNTTSMEVNVWYPGGTPSVYIDDYVLVPGSSSPAARSIQPSSVTIINQPLNTIKIYPNPVIDKLITVSIPPSYGSKTIYLYDMFGRLLLTHKLSDVSTQQIRLNKNISSGTYLLKIVCNKAVHQEMIIVN